MSLRKRLRRARGLPLPSEHGPVHLMPLQAAQWVSVDCPGCGLPVFFESGQRVNTCGWCHRSVSRGLAE